MTHALPSPMKDTDAILEIEDLSEWTQWFARDLQRSTVAARVARLSRAEMQFLLATRLAPVGCCTRRDIDAELDPGTLTDDDLRQRVVEAETFAERMAA